MYQFVTRDIYSNDIKIRKKEINKKRADSMFIFCFGGYRRDIEFALHYKQLGIGYLADKMEHAEYVCQCCLGIGT